MNWLPIMLCFFVPWMMLFFFHKKDIKKIIKNKKLKGDCADMKNLLTTLIGKKCIIHTIDGLFDWYSPCLIKTIDDNGLLCEGKKGNDIIVNIEYITFVEEVKAKVKK